MHRAGTLNVRFQIPSRGMWELWLQGQFMPSVSVAVDGRAVASIAGELAGNSLVPDTAGPVRLQLTAGAHRLAVTRAGFDLAPGNGGSAVLDSAFLVPAGTSARELTVLSPKSLAGGTCAKGLSWIELVPAGSLR
jgi:hypothetical protein